MKTMLGLSAAALAAAILLPAAAVQAQSAYNLIGIYTTEDADPAHAVYNGAPGQIEAYVVIQNPRNFNVGAPGSGVEQDISVIGGFEFKIVVPSGVFLLSAVLPPLTTNFANVPEFLCGSNLPVVDGVATCLTLQLGAFTQTPSALYITPVEDAPQSVPGLLAITDYNDDFRLNPAYPASGSFDTPVFGLWMDPIDPQPTYLWSVEIRGMDDAQNFAGVASNATDGYDADYDLNDGNVLVTFPRPEWPPASTDFRTDIRAPYDPTQAVKSWDFLVRVPDLSGTTTMGLSFVPSAECTWDLNLIDHTTGRTTDLRPALSYSYPTYPGEARRFTLQVGTDASVGADLDVGFSAAVNGLTDRDNRTGTHPEATDGYDPGLDLPEPGPPPANYVTACIERPGWPLGPRFQQDLRAPYDPLVEQRLWPLLVETDQSGVVVLDFTANFDGTDGIGMALHDLQTGLTHSLLPELRYGFAAPGGPRQYRFELIVGGVARPPLTPASRTVPAGWSLVAPPLRPEAGANTLQDVILGQAPAYSYLFSYAAGTGYVRQGPTEATDVGRGYWLGTVEDFTWSMTGSEVDLTTIPVQTGWNLVGYPLWFPGFVDGVRVTDGATTLSLEDALAANWLTGFVDYDGGLDDYVPATTLEPWRAYWVGAERTGLSLVFAWEDFVGSSANVAALKNALPLPDAHTWRCRLALDDGSGRVRSAAFGVDAEATAGFDARFDQPRPPAGPGGGASLAMVRPEWDLACGIALTTDVTAPVGKDPVRWQARITPAAPGEATLSWTTHRWPDDLDLQVYLPAENRVVVRSMRERDSVTLPVGASPLDVVFRTPDHVSAVGGGDEFAGYRMAAYPNPFNPSTTVAFSLPRQGRVAVRIYSVRGELVAELDGGTMPAGPGELSWRGRDREGRLAPSGTYFARLRLDGRVVGETARLSLVR